MSEADIESIENTKPTSFWDSIFGKIIRWITFIPISIIVLLAIETLSMLFFAWLFRDMRGFIVIGLMLGGIGGIFTVGLMYYWAAYAVISICPSPKVGPIVIGALYLVLALDYIAGLYRDFGISGSLILIIILKLIFAAIVLTVATIIFKSQNLEEDALVS